MKTIAIRSMVFASVSALALVASTGSAAAQTTRVDQPAPDSNSPAPAPQQNDATPGAPVATISGDQAASSGNEAPGAVQDVVVTGTLLRGVAPVGTNVIGVSAKDVTALGAQSSNDVLATIPQISNFNSFPTGGGGFGQPIVQTNLRGLGASGGTTTLTLVNGHRIVGSGILQTYVDPQIVPPALIQRVEVVPDGGSSIYGSDAIGGVINFITAKRFNGVAATARYGFADGYQTWDGNITAGKDWGSGSLFASYNYAWHNNLTGAEAGYVTQNFTGTGGADTRSLNCNPGNIILGTTYYPLPGRVAGTPNRCSTNLDSDLYPRETRHNVFVTLDQQLSPAISTNITAYYSRRTTTLLEATLATAGTITSANPYFQPVGAETSQRVAFNFAPAFGLGTPAPSRFDSWGVTPTFDANLGGSWHLRGLGNYGHSYNYTAEFPLNAANVAAALLGTTTATALNPYNVAASSAAVLASVRDYSNISIAKQNLAEGRLVADGHLFALGGGDVRLAVGTEYHHEAIAARIAFGSAAAPFTNAASAGRDVASVFGEAFVPIFGASNAIGGIQTLDLTASLRYDHYSDVGGTTNPKVGFNYRPIGGLLIRGNWGTSFHAPSLADTVGSVDARISQTTGIGYSGGLPIIYISGGNPALRPEKAHTFSIGADYTPDFYKPLTISATYYNIDFTDIISVNSGAFTQGISWYSDPLNAPFFIRNPTPAQITAFSNGLKPDNFPSLNFLYTQYGSVYSIVDFRRYNRGRLKQDGIDFNLSLNQPTGFGAVSASFGGTYTLHRNSSPSNNGVYTELLNNGVGRFNFIATAGAEVGPITARGTVTHSGGYPILFDATQSAVGHFDTVDAFLALNLEKIGLLRGAALTFNVNNIFDSSPPYRNAGNGYANGNTLGRLFQFGIRTKF